MVDANIARILTHCLIHLNSPLSPQCRTGISWVMSEALNKLFSATWVSPEGTAAEPLPVPPVQNIVFLVLNLVFPSWRQGSNRPSFEWRSDSSLHHPLLFASIDPPQPALLIFLTLVCRVPHVHHAGMLSRALETQAQYVRTLSTHFCLFLRRLATHYLQYSSPLLLSVLGVLSVPTMCSIDCVLYRVRASHISSRERPHFEIH